MTKNWKEELSNISKHKTSTNQEWIYQKETRCIKRGSCYLPQTCGLILDVIGQQDNHAELFALVRQFQHTTLKVCDVAIWKFILLIHHFHCFCVFLNSWKKQVAHIIVCTLLMHNFIQFYQLTLFSLNVASVVAFFMNFSCQFPLK